MYKVKAIFFKRTEEHNMFALAFNLGGDKMKMPDKGIGLVKPSFISKLTKNTNADVLTQEDNYICLGIEGSEDNLKTLLDAVNLIIEHEGIHEGSLIAQLTLEIFLQNEGNNLGVSP